MTIIVLLAALAAIGIAFTTVFISTAIRRGETRPTGESIALGAVTNFFDTLGIGSFATTTAWIKFRGLAPEISRAQVCTERCKSGTGHERTENDAEYSTEHTHDRA